MTEPISLFGIGLSMSEVMSLAIVFIGFISTFITIKARLESVEKRNEKADAKMADVEKVLSDKIADTNTNLNDRLHSVENRVTQQEVIIARMDEKLSYIHSDVKRIIDLNEKK